MAEYCVSEMPYRIRIVDNILDNIHGQIGLTPVERIIERLPIFKRLHNISQLGLVNRIFPCAVHTRYSHSLGVMHVAALMAESINGKFPVPFFTDNDIQIIRLAGLLHDIGHYPMSHNIETAYRNCIRTNEPIREQLKFYINLPDFLNPNIGTDAISPSFLDKYSGSTGLHHECIGYNIIVNNKSLFNAIKNNYVLITDQDGQQKLNSYFSYKTCNNPMYDESEVDAITKQVLTTIGNIVIGNYSYQDNKMGDDAFVLGKYSAIVQLIHSDLDADNIDYLLRDATFSGTSYGTMDMGLLVESLTVSEFPYAYKNEEVVYDGKRFLVGILPKRIGCVEQFLLAKYMAYAQVVYNKYVSALEAMLLRVAYKIIVENCNGYSRSKLLDLTKSNETNDFLSFNDSYVLNRIRDAREILINLRGISMDVDICKQLYDNLAFNVSLETSSVALKEEEVEMDIKRSDVYRQFISVLDKLDNKSESNIRDELLRELLSYRFENYKLTTQLPHDIFQDKFSNDMKTEELKFKSNYFRLARGIPIIDGGVMYGYDTLKPDKFKLPDLIVDSKASLLHSIYSLSFVCLRKYDVRYSDIV